MFKTLFDIWKIPELRRRIMWTLGLLAISRVGFQIFLPGVRVENFSPDKMSQGGDGLDIFAYTSRLTGGNFDRPMLFSLGIMPYITASIIFSLLVKVFPRLDALSKEGEQGRRVINRYTRYATVLIAVVQGLLLVSQWRVSGTATEAAMHLSTDPESTFMLPFLQLLCLTTGSLFMMWLGEKITEYGIGNGASLLIMVGIISSIPDAFARMGRKVVTATPDQRPFEIVFVLILVLLYFGIVASVVFITKGQRRIPVQQQRSVRGRKVYGGQRSYMPLKVNPAGVMPIIFAQSLIVLPTGFLGYLAGQNIPGWMAWFFGTIASVFAFGSLMYIVAYVGLIVFFTYFWTGLMFNPVEIANNMKESGSFIPGIRPGKRTAEYLEKVMKRITLAGASFLALIALVPQIVHRSLDIDFMVATFLGGTGILIVVGVALDLVDKIEAQLLVRQYEGFMRGGEGPRGGPAKKPVPTV